MAKRFDPVRHHRRSIRIPRYDYASPGAYFITVCTRDREHLFGDIVDDVMRLSVEGEWVDRCWSALPDHFADIAPDAWVVMPNHVHGIIVVRARGPVRPTDHADAGVVGARHAVPLRGTGNVDRRGSWEPIDGVHVGGSVRPPDRANPGESGGLADRADVGVVGARHAVPLRGPTRESFGQPIRGSIPTIIRSFKSGATRRINQHRGTPGAPVWQRGYYEHIIHDEVGFDRIVAYIAKNPAMWQQDALFADGPGTRGLL